MYMDLTLTCVGTTAICSVKEHPKYVSVTSNSVTQTGSVIEPPFQSGTQANSAVLSSHENVHMLLGMFSCTPKLA